MINSTVNYQANMDLIDNIINTNNLGTFRKYQNNYKWFFSPQELEEELEYQELFYKIVKVKNDKGLIFSVFCEEVKFQKSNINTKKRRKD